MEFLEALETIKAEEASAARLYKAEANEGFVALNNKRSPQYLARLSQAASFLADVYEGRRRVHHLQEAMSTSDFPQLFGDVLDRQLYGAYKERTSPWMSFARKKTVPDFRTVKRFVVDGAEGQLSAVGELAAYQYGSVADSQYTYTVGKYGKKLAFSWEAMINDDLDGLKDMPNRLAKAARRTENKFVTGLYCTTTGPHTSLYTSGNANIINTTNGAASTNPVLSVAALQDGFNVCSRMLDADSEPITIEQMVLVVPPALEITALNILSALQLEITSTAGGGYPDATSTGGQRLITSNWLKNRLKLVVDPYIPIVATTNGHTSWFLFADPNESRPALEVGFLRGHETPELFMKAPNAVSLSGSAVTPASGDFDVDAIEYKVRHVFGGARIDGKMTVASNGSGS